MIGRRATLALLALGGLVGTGGGTAVAFDLRSSGFSPGGAIPAKYTCDAADISPPLSWADPPAVTKGFVLIADDPDAPAGTWIHWVLYGLVATARELREGVPARERVKGVGLQGLNDFRTVGYRGPCPPRGPAHRYVFRLYALDSDLGLLPGKTKAEVLKAIEGRILGQAELMGQYTRK